MSELENDSDQPASKSGKVGYSKRRRGRLPFLLLPVYTRTEQPLLEGLTVVEYLLRFFSEADWTVWLMVMIPYSLFFQRRFSRHLASHTLVQCATTAIDQVRPFGPAPTSCLSSTNRWARAPCPYLAKRHDVPGWQALSTMVMLGLMEIYQLLFFSGIGVLIYYELVQEASTQIRLI